MTSEDMRSLIINIVTLFLASAFIVLGQNNKRTWDITYPIYKEAIADFDSLNYEDAYNGFKKYLSIERTSSDPSLYCMEKAYLKLSEIYMHGLGRLCNIDSVIYYLRSAADGYNMPSAARKLSRIYYLQKYNRHNLLESFKYLKLSADNGSSLSNLEIAGVYLQGESESFKDTTIYTTYIGDDNCRYRQSKYALTPDSYQLVYPFVDIDSISGYSYYVRGFYIVDDIINTKPLLTDLDIIRAYMNGTYLERNYAASWDYLKNYINFIDENKIAKLDSLYLGEIYWRIQMSYRFGLGTRVNMSKANLYLNKSIDCGFINPIEQ